jgi:hypothetical protein
MKIGLFVTGHNRGAPKNFENYRQFLEGHDTSVYVSTWSNQNINRYDHSVDFSFVDAETLARNAFGEHLKGLWIGDFRAFMNYEPPAPGFPVKVRWTDHITGEDPVSHAYPSPQRAMDQWYAVYYAYLMAQDVYDTFDVVIRIRGDQVFLGKPPIPFTDIADGVHVNGYTWWHNPWDREAGTLTDQSGLVPYALSDQLAWGTPFWMRKYFEYYLHWPTLWPGKVTVSAASPREHFDRPNSFLFNTEHMMSYYLLKYPYYKCEGEYDMPWHRHGHDDNPHNRFESDYYNWGS